MKLYRKEEKKDVNKIIEGVKAAYGNPDPIKTHGFAGTFLFSPGDVYLSDRIWGWVKAQRLEGYHRAMPEAVLPRGLRRHILQRSTGEYREPLFRQRKLYVCPLLL